MSWKDTLKMVVTGLPPSKDSLSRYGSVPVPGEATLQLPARKVVVYYAESQKAGLIGEDINFAVPPELRITVTPASGGAPLEFKVNRFGGGMEGTRKDFSYTSAGKVEVPADGLYVVSVSGKVWDDAVEPRILLSD